MDNKEVSKEVERRANGLRKKIRKRKNGLYIAASTVSCIVLVVGLAAVLQGIMPEQPPESTGLYSATLLADSSVGGYILVGVASFVLGVAVTLMCVKYIKRNGEKHG